MLSYCQMQSDDINKRKIITSVEIVDIPPPTDKEAPFKANEPAGTTKLSKEELQLLFQGRNLAFIATLSKDGSPHVTPVWAEMVDDLILTNTFESSAKIRI